MKRLLPREWKGEFDFKMVQIFMTIIKIQRSVVKGWFNFLIPYAIIIVVIIYGKNNIFSHTVS